MKWKPPVLRILETGYLKEGLKDKSLVRLTLHKTEYKLWITPEKIYTVWRKKVFEDRLSKYMLNNFKDFTGIRYYIPVKYFLFPAGMIGMMLLHDKITVDMSINLSCSDTHVPKHFLHSP